MIVTLTKDLNLLNLFLMSINEDEHENIIVGYDNKLRALSGDYKCKFINVDEFCDDFFLKFTTFKKCILIKHLLEQGYRNFLFVDDDSIFIKPINFDQTRVKPVRHVDFSCSEAAMVLGCTEHCYEAAGFVLNLSEEETKIYMEMFDSFVVKLKKNRHLFLCENERINEKNREIKFSNFFSDTMFLNMFFKKINRIEDKDLIVNYCDLSLHGFVSFFENYLRNNKLEFNILHFSGAPKLKYMNLYYNIKREKERIP